MTAVTAVLIHHNGTDGSTTFEDVTGRTITAAGSAQISTTQSKFGGASAEITGTPDYLSTAGGSHFDVLSTEAFTWEFFVYRTTETAYGELFDFGGTHCRGYVDNSGRLVVKRGTSVLFTGPAATDTEHRAAITLNTWHHVALVQDPANGYFYVFVNGHCAHRSATLSAVTSGTTAYLAGSSTPIGALSGYVDEQHFVKGEASYTYTGGSSPAYNIYTVPTAEFPAPPQVGYPEGVLLTKYGTPELYQAGVPEGVLLTKYGTPQAMYNQSGDVTGVLLTRYGDPDSTLEFVARAIIGRNVGSRNTRYGTPSGKVGATLIGTTPNTRYGTPRAILNRHTGYPEGVLLTRYGTPAGA